MKTIWLALAWLLPTLLIAQPQTELSLRTASKHSIEYFISLPSGWRAGGHYSTVVVIPGAERNFRQFAEEFVHARKDRPMIIVAPLVTTNGGTTYKEGPDYRYDARVWAQIDSDRWKFDHDGILAVVDEVHRQYGGSSRPFVTGLEAAGHTIWALAFSDPERILAAALVAPNYKARYVNSAPSGRKSNLPLKVFVGGQDLLWKPDVLEGQWAEASAEARRQGLQQPTLQKVSGRGHEPLADAVLDWFAAFKSPG